MDDLFELAMLSDVGGGWPTNEDSFGHWESETGEIVFAIADGVGGSAGGEVASKLAVTTTLEVYRTSPDGWSPRRRLHRAVQRANTVIHDTALAAPELGGMATTLTAAVVTAGVLRAAHVGDSRLYLVRGDFVRQLTKDHNVASERARLRLISAEDVRTDPERSHLTRSLGLDLVASVDRVSLRLVPGDRLVLCTDGVHTLLQDQELGDYCREQSPRAACRSLISAAKRRRPTDNLTVAVMAIGGDAAAGEARRSWGARLLAFLGRAG